MPYGTITGAAAYTGQVLGMPLLEQGLTLRLMRDQLVKALAGRTDLDRILLDAWINDAYVDVATTFKFPETQFSLSVALVPSQPYYTMPSNIDYTTGANISLPENISFRYGQRLDKIDLTTYRRLPDLSGTGLQSRLEPGRYLVYGNVLIVYPMPWIARTLVLDGSLVPQPLVNDTDSPILSREWHRAIVLKAREIVLTDNNSPQEALLAANNFARYVQARTDKTAIEKTNRLASASVPRGGMGYDLGQNSGNPFVDDGDRGYYGV